MASENEETPLRRSGARHARPRLTVRRRMQAPVGRAIAITAMPTALLMGTLAPKLAFADTKAPQATTVADTTSTGESCTQGTNTPSPTSTSATSAPTNALVKAAKVPQQAASTAASAVGSATGAASAAASKAPSAAASATKSTKAVAPKQVAPSATTTTGATSTPAPTATATPSPSASASSSSKASDPIGGLLDGLGSLLGLGKSDATAGGGDVRTADSTPSAAASASASPSASPSHSPSASASPSASPSDSPTASASSSAPAAKPSASATTTSPTPSASSTASADPNKLCDISKMAAPLDPNADAVFPADSWVLHASTLKLTNSIFHGVVTVHTRGGDKRVLKFTATAIDIGDLDMSTNQRGQKLHVQGAKGSNSTMRSGTVTMYVEKLSGKLEAAEGLPVGILGINLTLTPDTLPQWLYNLVGSVPIPLNLTLSGVEVIQAGQQGGTLTIPGMHLYYTAG